MIYPYADTIEGIVCSNEAPHHYCLAKGKRHHILSADFYKYENISGLSVTRCSVQEIQRYPLAQPISPIPASLPEARAFYEARAFLLRGYEGRGVEFGAATQPLPLPIICDVQYADLFEKDQGVNYLRSGEFVNVDINTSINDMQGIQDDSLDFLLGSHIIEHSPNPIEVLKKAYAKLKRGGRLFLVVPQKHYTFDRPRALTSLDHLVQDYLDCRYNRDALNVMDFIGNVDPAVRPTIDAFGLCKKYLNREAIDVHYHTYTEESFQGMLDWTRRYVAPWDHSAIVPRVKAPMEEFYVELVK